MERERERERERELLPFYFVIRKICIKYRPFCWLQNYSIVIIIISIFILFNVFYIFFISPEIWLYFMNYRNIIKILCFSLSIVSRVIKFNYTNTECDLNLSLFLINLLIIFCWYLEIAFNFLFKFCFLPKMCQNLTQESIYEWNIFGQTFMNM